MSEEITLEKLLENRSSTYGLLSRIFRVEVDQELLDTLIAMRYPKSTGNRRVDEGYKLIRNYLNKRNAQTLTDLAVDFTRTFIGHGVNAFSAAYPFESVYTSPRRLRMQEAREDICLVYRKAGIVKGDWKEDEDHISLELAFMQILINRTIEALQADDEDKAIDLLQQQYDFMGDHLLNWITMFTNDIAKFAQTDFYRGAGELLRGFLKTDNEFLEDILAEE